jgi:hypothetical protein
MSNQPRSYSHEELAAWCLERAKFVAAYINDADGANDGREVMRETMERDVSHLKQIGAILGHLARTREATPEQWRETPIDPSTEYGAPRNFVTALEVIIAAHMDARAYALLLFRDHGKGRISMQPVANVPRSALHESLGLFWQEGAFLGTPK